MKKTKKKQIKHILVIDTSLINRYLFDNGIGLQKFYECCNISRDEFENLFDYKEHIDNSIFYKLAKTIGVKVERLFVGISQEAKSLLKKYQNPLPCNLD